jgi:hypothetical protein
MFSGLFEAVETHLPGPIVRLAPEQHKDMLDQVLSWLSSDAEPLLGAAQAILGDDIYKSSKIGFEYFVTKPDQESSLGLPIRFAEMYIRPTQERRDISLNIGVARGHRTQRQVFEPEVDIELEIQELAAKEVFKVLYKDYHAQIGRLLEQGQIKFFTSYCSDIVGKSKSNKVSAKLDEYFTDTKADCSFSLSLRCSADTSCADAIRGFLALSLLYIACRASLAGKGGRTMFEKNLAKLI